MVLISRPELSQRPIKSRPSGKATATAVGALINLALFLALLFWPSGDDESFPASFGETRQPDPSPRGGAMSVAAEHIARASGEFGRRPG
jgi:hypothetical protein